MPSAVGLREDYSAEALRGLARRSKDVDQSRRLLSLAGVRDGMDRGAAARIGGWIARRFATGFTASTPPVRRGFSITGPKARSPGFRPSRWPSLRRLSRLARSARETASCAGGVSIFKRVIAERFGVDFHERYVGTLLKKIGFSHISARPRHPVQDERIVEAFKNVWPAPFARGCAEIGG
jgi:Winged helix-turn helix